MEIKVIPSLPRNYKMSKCFTKLKFLKNEKTLISITNGDCKYYM
jgi:hypothetical protein